MEKNRKNSPKSPWTVTSFIIRGVIFWFFGAFLASYSYAEGGASAQSLLDQANKALSGKKSEHESPPESPTPAGSKTPVKKQKKMTSSGKQTSEESSETSDEGPTCDVPAPQKETLRAMNTSDLDRLLTLELAAEKKDAEPADPRFWTVLSAGVSRIDQGYVFTKDDDEFRIRNGSKLQGVKVSFIPSWRIPSWSSSYVEASSLVSGGLGYFSGEPTVERTGIESEVTTYEYHVIPLDLSLGLGLDTKNRFGFQLFYGFAGDLVSQIGKGESDTVSEYILGDAATLQFIFRITQKAELILHWQKRGVGLLKYARNTAASSSQVYGIGFGINLAG